MKKNRKWSIALCGVMLLTLFVGGGALAAVGDRWETITGPTLVWEIDQHPYKYYTSITAAGIPVTVTSAIETGQGIDPSGGGIGPISVVQVNVPNYGLTGYYIAISDLVNHGIGSTTTANAGAYVYQKKSLTSHNNLTIPVNKEVIEQANSPSFSGYLEVRYVDTGIDLVGYVSTSDIKKASSTTPTPPPSSDQITIRNRNGAQVYDGSGNVKSGSSRVPYNTTLIYDVANTINGETYYYVVSLGGYIKHSDTVASGGSGGGQSSGRTAYIINGSLALRSSDSNANSGNIIRYYPEGTAVEIINTRSNGWSEIKIVADGATGFVMSRYLSSRRGGSNDIGWGGGGSGGGSSSQPVYATVSNPSSSGYVNLRRSANSNSEILGRFNNGQQVTILEYGPAWCRVQIGALEGYMMTSLLKLHTGSDTSNPSPSTSNPTIAHVNNPNPTDRLNLRAQPTTSSTSLGRYYNGTEVKVYEYGNTWCYVEVNGIRGYMMTMYLSFNGSYNSGSGSSGGSGSSSGTMYAVVNNPVSTQKLNLRAQPTTASTSLGQFYNGTPVTVHRYGTEWCEVTVNGIRGYMMTRYLSFSGGTPSTSTQYAVVKNPVSSQYLNLRASADITSRSLAQFYNGTSVKILEYGLEWCRVEVNGLRGYMMTRYLQFV